MLLVDVDAENLGRRQGVGHEQSRVFVPGDHVDLFAAQLGDHRLDACPALADGRANRIEALLARCDGHFRAAAGFPRDGLDLDRAGMDLRHLELEQAT